MPRGDAIRLTVSEIRQKIFEASDEPSQRMGALAGQLFHRAADCALRDEHPAFWQAVLTRELNAEKWARTLYDQALGPELTKSQSALRENGAEVLQLWHAVRSFANWFCGLLAEAMQLGAIRYDERKEAWLGAASLFDQECDLTATLREPDWTAEVIVAGRADHLIRLADNRWCIVEFKLGGGHAESDAAQACLYHELLGGGAGSAALVRFNGETEPDQLLLASDWIAEARPKLLTLIGSLARVTVRAPRDRSNPEPRRVWPKPADEAEIKLGKRVIEALVEFNAEARLAAEPLVGPTFVRFLLEPGRGVAASRIERQGPNLQLRLQLEKEPMIGRSEGRIVVDVQRPDREYVPFDDLRGVLESKRNAVGNSHVLAGLDLKGKVEFIDLAGDSPHLLVGGMPGSGKSEWLRSAVASLLVTNTPDTLRLVLVDPKKNAFGEMAGSEYLWRPDTLLDSPQGRVIPLLAELIDEMQRRYELFQQYA
jgi:DNA segregation ATPase FtsK/SpoIIIE, S-DNA-T family